MALVSGCYLGQPLETRRHTSNVSAGNKGENNSVSRVANGNGDFWGEKNVEKEFTK